MSETATKDIVTEGEIVEHEDRLPAHTQEPTNPIQLLSQAVQRNVSPEHLRELMQLEREYRADKAKAEFAEAMTKFASLKQNIRHNRTGKTAGNATFTYADYPTMVKAISPWLFQCGLSFSHREDAPMFNQEGAISCIMVYCDVKHIAGHTETVQFPAIPDTRLNGKVSPSQLIQLAITYAKRQTLAMALGLATSEDARDDDSSRAPDMINDEQLTHLREVAKKANRTDEAKLCAWLRVDSLEDLTVEAYEKAVVSLEQFV